MYRCLRSICINLYQYVSTFDVNFLPNVRQCWMFTMTLRALAALYKRRQFHRRDSLKSNWHNFLHQNCVSVRRDDRNSKCLTDFILLVPPNPKKSHQEIQGISQRNSKWQIGSIFYCCRHAHRFRIQKKAKILTLIMIWHLSNIYIFSLGCIFAWMVEKSFTSGTDQVQDLQSPEEIGEKWKMI